MNYIDLLKHIKKFKEVYLEIADTSEDSRKLIKDKLFDETIELENALLAEMFDSDSNVEMLCVNFIEQINSLECLCNNRYRAALALFNTYEIFIQVTFLLYKEERYEELRNLVTREFICSNFFSNLTSVDCWQLRDFFNEPSLFIQIATITMGLNSLSTEQINKVLYARLDASSIGYDNYAFTETLIANILLLKDSFFKPELNVDTECFEFRALVKKVKNCYDELGLAKLFGLPIIECKTKISSYSYGILNPNFYFFRQL